MRIRVKTGRKLSPRHCYMLRLICLDVLERLFDTLNIRWLKFRCLRKNVFRVSGGFAIFQGKSLYLREHLVVLNLDYWPLIEN